MSIDFKNSGGVIKNILSLFKTPTVSAPPLPQLIPLLSGSRPGLSTTKIVSRIISRQDEAGLPIGRLPSGEESIEEKMERIRVEEIIRAITQEARITITISPGQSLFASGGNAGGPIFVVGSTTTPGIGYGVLQ